MDWSAVTVVIEGLDPRHPDGVLLIARLSADLAARYPEDPDGGAGHFCPDDVLVPRSIFVVGRLGGQPVACGALRPVEPDVAEVKRMYVEPGFRGRGLSRRILAELEEYARRFGYRRVWLETGIRQPEAIRLYESAGYGRIANYGIYAGNLNSICFEKQLI